MFGGIFRVPRIRVAKNVNLAHIEEVALRFEFLSQTPDQVVAQVSDFTEFEAVLVWCLAGPTSRLISARLGAMRTKFWLIELQTKLALNPIFSTLLGTRIAEFSVKENWGEKAWLSRLRESGFYVDEIVRPLAMSHLLGPVTSSVTRNSKLFKRTFPSVLGDQDLRISEQFRAQYGYDSPDRTIRRAQTDEEIFEVTQLFRGYLAWAVAITAVSLLVYGGLDDLVDSSENTNGPIELVSVTNLDAHATTGVAQTAERFLGLFSELLQSGKLGEFDQAAGEHNLRQLLGEMQNPEGATGHVLRGYQMKMVEIYHRHIGIQGLRLVADDETVEKVESAITQAIEMGNAVEPEKAAKLAESIPTSLLPSQSNREKFTSALGWTSGAALATTAGGGLAAKLIEGLGELGKILPAPWGAMIGAILGLLAYTFKPKGKS
jgi:hypothetical protein